MLRALLVLIGATCWLAFGCDDQYRCCCPAKKGIISVNLDQQRSDKGNLLRFDYAGFGSACAEEGVLQSLYCRLTSDSVCKELNSGDARLLKSGNKIAVDRGDYCSFELRCTSGQCIDDRRQWVGKYKMRPGPTYPPPVVTPPAIDCEENANGTTINHADGSTWEKGPCEQCTCTGGSILCTVVDCPEISPLCISVNTSGCCPVCKDEYLGCLRQNNDSDVQLVPHSTRWLNTSSWLCTECACNNGVVNCTGVAACDWLPGCIEHENVNTSCCPVCKKFEPQFVKCYGEEPLMDAASGIEVTCDPDDPRCPNGTWCHVHPYEFFAVCCPNQTKDQCEYQFPNGTQVIFEPSDAFIVKSDGGQCQECNCTGAAEIECTKKKKCKPVPGCIQYQESQTECCPTCTIRGPAPCKYRFPNGTRSFFMSGSHWAVIRPNKQCKQCECVDGDAQCGPVACDPIPGCQKYEESLEFCCPGCEEWNIDEIPCRNLSSPLTDSTNATINCGRGQGPCPSGSYCHTHPTDVFAVCCETDTPPTPDVCELVECRKYQECLINGEGVPYCADTCENNGGCADDKVCELVAVTCDTAPCPKQSKCRGPGPFKGGSCIYTTDDGRVGFYNHGDSWMSNKCTMCTCQDGASNCHTQNCTITGCIAYSKPNRTQCCGTCLMYNESAVQKVYPGACVVSTDNHQIPQVIRMNGDKWFPDPSDPCSSCSCDNGDDTCLAELCVKDRNCIAFSTRDDVCCPSCVIDNTEACLLNTSGYILTGTRHQQNPCTSCKCRKQDRGEAKLVCKTLDCQRLNRGCYAVAPPEEGECCGKCIAPPTPASSLCNVTLASGEIMSFEEGNFSVGHCDACTCYPNGTYSCEFVEALSCPEVEGCLMFKEREIGSCCKECSEYSKDCYTTEGNFKHGSGWYPENDTCQYCFCENRNMSCIQLECPEIEGCQRYGSVDPGSGECCPPCVNFVEVAVDVCALPQEPGQCRGLFKRWYFNYQSRQCEEFVYTGCSGNGNNFATRAKCESQCMVETCHDPLDLGHGGGRFKRFFYNQTSMRCERFVYQGLGGNGNRYESKADCVKACYVMHPDGKQPNEVCVLPPDSGPCRASNLHFYYDAQDLVCKPFTHGGCKGNSNNFKKERGCEKFCAGVTLPPTTTPTTELKISPTPTPTPSAVPLCTLPMAVGPCRGQFPRHYFNHASKRCELFTYGGCGGNRNRFMTLAECQSTCPVDLYPMEACMLDVRPGPCKARYPRYFYNTTSSQCEKFIYGGCQSNTNNFLDIPSCLRHCASGPTACIDRQQKDISACKQTGCFITQCTVVGEFISKQCNDSTGDCWCVNKDGESLHSAVPLVHAAALDCDTPEANFTKCERKRQKKLRDCGKDLNCFVFSCEKDGSFSPKQCYSDGSCYCVDEGGREILGHMVEGGLVCNPPPTERTLLTTSTTKAVKTPSTESPSAITRSETESPTSLPEDPCGAMPCKYGATCVDGACECKFYCTGKQETVCGTDGQVYSSPCELSRVACLQMKIVGVLSRGRCHKQSQLTDSPQPNTDLPMQEPTMELTIEPTIEPTLLPSNVCTLPVVRGKCRAFFRRYFFNSTSGNCESFVYGGCGGNANNFESFSECQAICGGQKACIVNLREGKLIYEDTSDTVFGVTNQTHLAPTCHFDIVFLIDNAVVSFDPTTIGRQIARHLDDRLSRVTSTCPNPQVRFGLVRLSFPTSSYAQIPLGDDGTYMGTFTDLRQALREIDSFFSDKILPKGADPILPAAVDALESYNLCITDDCGCYRHFILIANKSLPSQFPYGDEVHNTLIDGHVLLHSIVETGLDGVRIGYTSDALYQAAEKAYVVNDQDVLWPSNRLAQIALQTTGSVWEFDKSQDKSLQKAVVDMIESTPTRLQEGCHMCACQESALQCCYLYGRTKGTCKVGCEFERSYVKISDDPPVARSFTVPPDDDSVCEIVVVVEETIPGQRAIDWVQSGAFCHLAKTLTDSGACGGGINFGLLGFGEQGRDGRCGHIIEFGINGGQMWGSCMELQAVASLRLNADTENVRGDVYCALDSVINDYGWTLDSYKSVIVVSPSARRVRQNDVTTETLISSFQNLNATLVAVVDVSFTAVSNEGGSPFGLANAGLRDAYFIDSNNISLSGYDSSSRGSYGIVSDQIGSDLAQMAYDIRHGSQYGSAWNFNELISLMSQNQDSVFNNAFADSLTDSFHSSASVCVECRCQDASVKCTVLENQPLHSCLPMV